MGEDRGICWFGYPCSRSQTSYSEPQELTLGYDANIQCEYHAGITGHSIENCATFKKLVEKFINRGIIKFDDSSNLLPDHVDNGVGVRARRGLVISDSRGNHGKTMNHREFHHEKGYETQESVELKTLVPGMIDDKEMEFCEEIKEERNMHIMLGSVHINSIYKDTLEKGPC
ncbi:hypothetical protein GOBAR_DD03684 [Gossypium barbadense]|nr:hypothetical protein GOBAR_DD03684 [Gossypium barbadense]